MQRPSAVTFQGEQRVHIGLEVTDLERSIAFYRVLLGEQPVKRRPGYAKFEPRSPSLNRALNEGRGERSRPGNVSHLGIQVQSGDAVQALVDRLRAGGLHVRVEHEVACCYAVQDKAWVEDPDGNSWEVFVVVQAESDVRTPPGSTCCAPVGAGPDAGADVRSTRCC